MCCEFATISSTKYTARISRNVGRSRRRMAREMWEHLFLMLAEIAHFPRKVHDTNWRDYIRFQKRSSDDAGILPQSPASIVPVIRKLRTGRLHDGLSDFRPSPSHGR